MSNINIHMIYWYASCKKDNINTPLLKTDEQPVFIKRTILVCIALFILGSVLVVSFGDFENNSSHYTEYSDEWLSALFNATTNTAIECSGFNFSLCDLSTCVVPSDTGNLLAVCGCLEMPASATSTLALGWQSGVLAASTAYLQWLEKYNTSLANHKDSKILTLELCSMLPSLWNANVQLGNADLISMYATTSISYDLQSTSCRNTYGANCQGAPCFRHEYQGLWNTTCLCQLTPTGDHYAYSTTALDNSCNVIRSENTSCALATSSYIKNIDRVRKLIDIIFEYGYSLTAYALPKSCPITASI